MPFATAGELIAHKRRPHTHQKSHRDIFAITLLKIAAVAVAIGVFYLTGLYE